MPGFETDKREPGHYPEEERRDNREAKESQVAEAEARGVGGRQGREGETPVATTDGGFWSWFRRRR